MKDLVARNGRENGKRRLWFPLIQDIPLAFEEDRMEFQFDADADSEDEDSILPNYEAGLDRSPFRRGLGSNLAMGVIPDSEDEGDLTDYETAHYDLETISLSSVDTNVLEMMGIELAANHDFETSSLSSMDTDDLETLAYEVENKKPGILHLSTTDLISEILLEWESARPKPKKPPMTTKELIVEMFPDWEARDAARFPNVSANTKMKGRTTTSRKRKPTDINTENLECHAKSIFLKRQKKQKQTTSLSKTSPQVVNDLEADSPLKRSSLPKRRQQVKRTTTTSKPRNSESQHSK